MLSSTAEYALRAMVHLATNPEAHCTSQAIAERTMVPSGYISKVLQDLAREGIVHSQRGPNGGFVLSKPPEKISLLAVINAVDPIRRIHKCPLGIPGHGKNLCSLHSAIDSAAQQVEQHFSRMSIADMASTSKAGSKCLFPSQRPSVT